MSALLYGAELLAADADRYLRHYDATGNSAYLDAAVLTIRSARKCIDEHEALERRWKGRPWWRKLFGIAPREAP